jgi:hypothetical protein
MQNKPAPPVIKEASVNWLMNGQTVKVLFYGENLAPKELSIKPPLTVKLLGVNPTDEKNKAKGPQTADVEITIPQNCPPECFEKSVDLTFVQEKVDGKDNNAVTKLCIMEKGTVEVPVKKPSQRFPDAMLLPNTPLPDGTSVGISGVLEGDNPCILALNTKRGETWEFVLTSSRAGADVEEVMRVRDSRRRLMLMATGRKVVDKRITFRPPADGLYYLEWMDTQGRGGEKTYFRLLVKKK